MGAAGGHPPYHCHAVPLHANNVSPPFSGFRGSSPPTIQMGAQRWYRWCRAPLLGPGRRCPPQSGGLHARGAASALCRAPGAPPSGGAPRSFFADCLYVGTQGPPLWCRAPPPSRGDTVPSVRGVPRVERGPNALQGSRCTSGPAGPCGSSTPVSPRGHPGAAPLTQGLFSRAGTAPSLPSAGLHTRSTTPAPSRAREAPSVRSRSVRKGNSVGADSSAETPSQTPFYFSFPSEPVGPRR
ncbi:hypothetical protein NDU88_005482 [Pleurodeles waltl]|uniref:Uncharacterized protein n=1 Tax=Pleurodeles waltl TaxID=8319 RepID=A0AAV7UI66_PLEWA|nr:hypothetical protein NDU88_005482 [Pleurodeles waltl]